MTFHHPAAFALAVALFSFVQTPAAAEVSIAIDTSLADRALSLVCTGAPVDEEAVRASPIVRAQISHNAGLRAAATMDAYVAGLRAASACVAPEQDPFNIAGLIEQRESLRAKVAALIARQDALTLAVAQRLERYMPPGASFAGSVVIAVPYFSCGGFAADDHFFIDIACLAEDIDADAVALELLVAHETYHVIQERHFRPVPDLEAVSTRRDALGAFFGHLLIEGTATHVGDPLDLPQSGGGPYTRLGRSFHTENARRMEHNFNLLTILIDYVARARDPGPGVYQAAMIGFAGNTYEEMGYSVGARMARDIEAAWGAPALVCVMLLPAEQFVLAHDAATAGQAGALRLGPPAVAAARSLSQRRPRADRFETCRP